MKEDKYKYQKAYYARQKTNRTLFQYLVRSKDEELIKLVRGFVSKYRNANGETNN